VIFDLPDSLIEDARAGRPIRFLGRRYVLDGDEADSAQAAVGRVREVCDRARRITSVRYPAVIVDDIERALGGGER
jgi:hypothetical protein